MSDDFGYDDNNDWANEENDDNGSSDAYVLDDEDDDDEMGFIVDDTDAPKQGQLESIIITFNAYLPEFIANSPDRGCVHVEIPSSILPLSMRSIYGYLDCPTLIVIDFSLSDFDWQRPVARRSIKHPELGIQFIGRPLVEDLFSAFFSPFYEPKTEYLSQSYVLTPSGVEDEQKVQLLTMQGYSETNVRNALRLCQNDIAATKDFLMTGDLPPNPLKLDVSYRECPLLYFVLEIADIFLTLGSKCCVCGAELPIPGLRPSACERPVCQFALEEFGVGTSVTQEIKRDPLAADLLVSLFSAALDTKFLTPRPPNELIPNAATMLASLPPMAEIAQRFTSDQELSVASSSETVALLRWILLSCKSQLLALPDDLKVKQFPNCHQFLALLASPTAEQEFRERKKANGSLWFWHGSGADRWHSIIRNGLRNLSGTALQANGAVLGAGIYFAPLSSTAFGYVREVSNKYRSSVLGKTIKPIALCEVAKTAGLKNHDWAWTLTDEKSCIVRMLIIGEQFETNVTNNPVTIPSLKEILEYHASHASK